jgi:predicted nucleotidyltransferase
LTTANLAQTLFGAYRRRVLAWLLLHPGQSYYVRELARLVEVPPGSLHRELKKLTAVGLLLRESVGNQVRYRANRDCPVFEELAGFFRKTAGLADVLRGALAPLEEQIEIACIFGSFAQGKERSTSDVDVLVVGNALFSSVVQAFATMHERLGREVNPVVLTKANFLQKLQKNDRFITRIVEEPKIFLIEESDDLGKLAEDRPA